MPTYTTKHVTQRQGKPDVVSTTTREAPPPRAAAAPKSDKVTTSLRLNDLLEQNSAPVTTGAAFQTGGSGQSYADYLASLDSLPPGSPERAAAVNARTQDMNGASGDAAVANAQRAQLIKLQQEKLKRAQLASQLMSQLNGIPEAQRSQFLPEDLQSLFSKPQSSIPAKLYQAIGTPEFRQNFNDYLASNPNAKRSDVLALDTADRAARGFTRHDAEYDARKADREANPYTKKLGNIEQSYKDAGLKFDDETRKTILKRLTLGKDAALLGEDDNPEIPVTETPEPASTPGKPAADPAANLKTKYGINF